MNLLSLLRSPNITTNVIMNDTLKKRRGLSFRKTLGVYNYKIKPKGYFKNPHALQLRLHEQLKQNGEKGRRKIIALEKLSTKPYGEIKPGSKCTIIKIDLTLMSDDFRSSISPMFPLSK